MFAQTVVWKYFKLNFLNVTSCGPMRLAVGLYTFSMVMRVAGGAGAGR